MAEWLGHLMSGWPTFLVAIVCVVVLVIGIFVYWYWSQAETLFIGGITHFPFKKKRAYLGEKRNGKK